ncbi:MAG: endonuclease, partial [Bacteroidales bacterium]
NGTIWDIYSDNPEGIQHYEFIFREDQCGTIGSTEGGCYNREHTFCQSWFGGGTGAPYSDLFHIYPVDGYINSTRNNFAYGEVTSPTRTFLNGSKFGLNSFPFAPITSSFEPIDEYKGDIARSFFYMATRYMNEDQNFATDKPMTYKSQLLPWAIEMFKNWHLLDPISEKEVARNNAIYGIQQNRNPFIDHPELVNKIWGNDSLFPFNTNDTAILARPQISSFEVLDATHLKMTFNMPVVAQTAQNIAHYTLSGGISVGSVSIAQDTLYLLLTGNLIQGRLYRLIVRNIQGENLYFMSDTSLSFTSGFPSNSFPVVGWTFDIASTSKTMQAGFNLSNHNATLYCEGSYGSSVFLNNQLQFYEGSTIGDPRLANAIAGKSLAMIGEGTNTHKIVLKFSTLFYHPIMLTLASRKTTTGAQEHSWEWSLDGEHYNEIENSQTIASGAQVFELKCLELSEISELNNQPEVFLRLTIDGAIGNNGNNRLDNIVVHGESSSPISSVPQKKNNSFQVIPNPVKNVLQINKLEQEKEYQRYQIALFTSLGQKVYDQIMSNSQLKINFRTFPTGSYVLRITNEKGEIVLSKMIIHH